MGRLCHVGAREVAEEVRRKRLGVREAVEEVRPMMWAAKAVAGVADCLLKAGEGRTARSKGVGEVVQVARSPRIQRLDSLVEEAEEGQHVRPLLLSVEAGAAHLLLQGWEADQT